MKLYENPNWDESVERWRAFWDVDCIDRPGVLLFGPTERYRPPCGKTYTPKERWADPEGFYQSRCYYRGEVWGDAFRVTYPNWNGVEAEFGAQLTYDHRTIWVHPIKGELEDIDLSRFSLDSKSVNELLSVLEYAASHCENRFFIAYPPMGC